ncbi:MAG: metallophosphoesterase, partial [Candidatus Nanopelagicales bacterium]
GDIACDPTSPYFNSAYLCQQDRVGRRVRILVNHGADWFVPLGDVQYETGSYADYVDVYDKAFGAVRHVTRPVPGNHEYSTPGARGYFRYFKAKAGSERKPWRSFKAAPGWRVLLLDSNCEFVGGCGPHSRQGHWIKRKLRRTNQPCVVAAWHHPLQTSGEYAGSVDSESRARKLWRLVAAGGADIVLNGHDHIYERFAKKSGMQEFVVGTGGKNHYSFTTHAPGSRARIGDRYGVLKLTMRANGTYRRAFVTASGQVRDRGGGSCTNRPAAARNGA